MDPESPIMPRKPTKHVSKLIHNHNELQNLAKYLMQNRKYPIRSMIKKIKNIQCNSNKRAKKSKIIIKEIK